MRVGAVEDDLAIVARAIKTIHRREDRADIELPSALEKIGDLVEQQSGMTAVDFHLLIAEAAPRADRRDRGANGAHQRDRHVMDFDNRVDIARCLINENCVGRVSRQSQLLRDGG